MLTQGLTQATVEKINSDECPLLDACCAVLLGHGNGAALMALEEILRVNIGEATLRNFMQNKEQIERRCQPFWLAQANRDAEMFRNSKPKLHQLSPEEIQRDEATSHAAFIG